VRSQEVGALSAVVIQEQSSPHDGTFKRAAILVAVKTPVQAIPISLKFGKLINTLTSVIPDMDKALSQVELDNDPINYKHLIPSEALPGSV
jgi:hypothetical protein